jgi:hypothetical protein
MDIVDKAVSVVVLNDTFYFPGVKIWRHLEKNIIVIKLPGKNVGKDLLRVVDSFKLSGTWQDDDVDKQYDSKTAFARYLRAVYMIKTGDPESNQGPLWYLTWGGVSHKTRIKSATFEKLPGRGKDFDYELEFVKVTK